MSQKKSRTSRKTVGMLAAATLLSSTSAKKYNFPTFEYKGKTLVNVSGSVSVPLKNFGGDLGVFKRAYSIYEKENGEPPNFNVIDLHSKAKQYEHDNGHKLSLLFICAGNTCRSATAEAIAKDLLGNSAIIKSAGLRIRGATGDPMKHHAQAIHCGSQTCYPQHSSKHVTKEMISNATNIFVMDDGLLKEINDKHKNIVGKKVKLLCESGVPDPYFSPKSEISIPLSARRGAYYKMNMAVKQCLIDELNKILSSKTNKALSSAKCKNSLTKNPIVKKCQLQYTINKKFRSIVERIKKDKLKKSKTVSRRGNNTASKMSKIASRSKTGLRQIKHASKRKN